MIAAQYNILGFYDSLEKITWNRLIDEGANQEVFRVFLETNHVPAIELIADYSAATTATLEVYDINDNLVSSVLSMTVEDATTYKRLIYTGTTLTGKSDGDYYLKITHNSEVVYSDVFGWTSNADYFNELVKISATSGNIKLGRNYTMNLTGFTFECYLNAAYIGLNPEFPDEVAQKDGMNNVLYGNLVPSHEFDIDAAEYIYRFLLGLRVLESNGTVTATWKGLSYTANDIRAEVTEEHLAGFIYQIKLSFVDVSEIVSVVNETN